MAYPTPTFTPPDVITANGTYLFRMITGDRHLFTLKGSFGGGTVTFTTYDEATDDGSTYDDVDGGSWTAATEQEVTAPSGIGKLVLSGATAPSISFHFVPIRNK